MNLKETYNKIAEDWHSDHKKDDWWIEGTDKFISFLNKDDLVLDVGCAGGIKSKYLIENGLNVVGMDFSEKMVEIAKCEVPNGEFLVKDMANADTLNYIFDAIFMQAVPLHIPKVNAKEIIKKLAKKLKRGGYFYIAVKAKKPGRAEEEVSVEEDYGYRYERFFSFFTLKEIKQYMKESGLDVIYETTTDSGRATWIQVIAQKK
ncbi:MAG: Methyltransferase type 11 [Parcubacteria group bacterium GW2011_GWA1_40_21]|nr:MAG: hypothetical protein UT80_C0018G0004 [Parcubacteria group bacterium GW2011_GWC1_40_13]KKR53090.1 MAG: Methyltransferase type 11 [Parcubacteria group bacterium GW2011_GWA1_40_21]